MSSKKVLKEKHRFKVGDIVEAQGARLKIVDAFITGAGVLAYACVSPFTKGEPWLVSAEALATARKVRKF